MRATISEIIGMEYKASNTTRCMLDAMVQGVGLEKIREQVVKPLSGF